MNVVLKSFTQESQLSDPSDIKHLLVFEVDGEKELRLPVPEETVKALIKAIYVEHAPEKVQESSIKTDWDVVREEATDSSRAASDEDFVEDAEEDDAERFGGEDVPSSEEDIPSL